MGSLELLALLLRISVENNAGNQTIKWVAWSEAFWEICINVYQQIQ